MFPVIAYTQIMNKDIFLSYMFCVKELALWYHVSNHCLYATYDRIS